MVLESKKRKIDLAVVLFAISQGGKRYEFYMQERDVLSLDMEKDQLDTTGGFSFDLKGNYKENWKDIITPGDLAHVVVDGKLKMQGLVQSVGYGSSQEAQGISNRTSVKVLDLTWLLTKFGKFMSNYTWRTHKSTIGVNFFNAFKAIQQEYNYTEYDLRRIFEVVWTNIIKAYIDTIQQLTGKPFQFSDGTTLDKFGANLFNLVSDQFDISYPLTINIFQENWPSIWAFYEEVANRPFNELYTDTVYKGQKIAIFGQSGTYHTAFKDGFRVMCRPNPWLEDRFKTMLPEANNIDPIKMTKVEATKSGSEVKSFFLVYPSGGIISPNAFKVNGDFAIDERLLGSWGLDIMETPISFVSQSKGKDVKEYVVDTANKLQKAFSRIDSVWSGQATLAYHDVRIGDCVVFPDEVGSPDRMGALVTHVLDSFKAPATAITKFTFVRGEMLTSDMLNTYVPVT